MDLNEIAIFIKVVQTGSFSQAAKALNLPNSTVSYKVSSLERRLGVTLIQRTTRKLNITPAGEAYYKRCVSGLEEINAAEVELTSIQGEPQGLLRITAPVDIGASILPSITSKYMAKYPKVRIEIILSDRRVDLLSESVDLAIRAGELKDSTLIAKRIGTTYFVPVASPKYLKINGIPEHPRELIKHKCLQFTPIGIDTWKFVGPKGSLNVSVPGKVMINHFEMLKMMALMDDGIAYLPTTFVYPEVKSGKLVRILPEWRSALSPIHFVYPAQRFVTPKLSSFIEHASSALKQSLENFEI